jgi:hypothetical protein
MKRTIKKWKIYKKWKYLIKMERFLVRSGGL